MDQPGGQKNAPPWVSREDVNGAMINGLYTGAAGFVVGSHVAIFRRRPIALEGIVLGGQCFLLTFAICTCRAGILSAWHDDRTPFTSRTYLSASALAGGGCGVLFGALGSAFFGRPRLVISSGFVGSAFGAGGQVAYNAFERVLGPRPADDKPKPGKPRGILEWVSRQPWSPIKKLSDAEYADILREKILNLDVEIALIDDRIAEIKKDMDHSSDDHVTETAEDTDPQNNAAGETSS